MTCRYDSKRIIYNIISTEEKYESGVLGVQGDRDDASRENPGGAKEKT